MGFFTELVKQKDFPGQGEGRRLWDRTFGQSKEPNTSTAANPVRGDVGSNRTLVSSDASFKRLLQAIRSMAPGGWSDDRYQQTARFESASYVSIDRKARQLARSEFQVYIKDENLPDGKRPVRKDDPPQRPWCKPYDLIELLQKPNNQDHFGLLMWRWEQQLDLTGMALTWMIPNELGIPVEIYPMPTCVCLPQPAINPDYPDGYYRIQPIYPYGPFSSWPTPNSAVGAPIPAQWMMRFLYPHPLLRYDGFSPQTGLRKEIDAFNMINTSRHATARRAINPSGVVQMDDAEGAQPWNDDQIERIRAEFENDHQGPENAGRLMVMSPGSRLEEFGARPVDMDYPNGFEQLLGFIMGGGFGITKQAAGMIEDSSYSTLFATLKQLHDVTLLPQCELIAAYLTRHLAPFYGDNLIVEIRLPRIDDHEIAMAKIDKLLGFKGFPETVIRYVMKQLDLPPDPIVIKDLAEASQKEMEMQQQAQALPGGEMPGMEGEEGMVEEEVDPAEMERPQPGNLGEGSLGPRMGTVPKSFPETQKKSMYGLVRGACQTNGYHM